ncbi:hypothetical protein [Pseudomonas sp.]|uniref:hypothetical protein n=1 Tax=Pseudomonas sp. TaxID=306 RepID=UPI00290C2DDF|nr:hypothetical protein [Pseudomonas sp.]MDU4254538.1 hypothetical protein [Pseudomonas sp.]
MNATYQPTEQEERDAALYYAYQFGIASVCEADTAAVLSDFDQKFGDDPEALEQFNVGAKEEEAKRAALGMTPEQYHAHCEAKRHAFRERQEKTRRGGTAGSQLSATVHYFCPDKTKETPFITEVEMLLGGIPQLMFPDGTYQFADQDRTPVAVYSPRLPEPELEAFCCENIERYQQHYQQNKEAIDNYETPEIVPFW